MTKQASAQRTGSILIIDDEPNILQGIRRQLRKRFDLVLAESGEQGLALLQEQGPFAVVVCDMNMPGRNGIDVLADVSRLSPDTVRIMLTGQADLSTAMDAVNHGNIFRFFTKPCATEVLAAGLEAGLKQYNLVTVERDLLDKTLSGSIKVVTDMLAMIDPESFGRTDQMRRWCRKVAQQLDLKKHQWKLELASMMAPIGLAALPPEVAAKARSNEPLSPMEKEMVDATAETAHNLICNIPRLNEPASYIRYQNKNVDGSGFPNDDCAGTAIPIGARIIRILNTLITAKETGQDLADTLTAMEQAPNVYDQELVGQVTMALADELGNTPNTSDQIIEIDLWKLEPGDVLLSPINDEAQDQLILAEGVTITKLHLDRLTNLQRLRELTKVVKIQRPGDTAATAIAS